MVQTIDELRSMVESVVKVKPNTDPTKTQGIRLRALLYNILDSVDDLVEKQGLSVYQGVMQELDNQQNAAIQDLRNELKALIEAIPDHSIYAIKTEVAQQLADYALTTSLNSLLTQYQKISDAFDKNYNSLTNKPDLSVYQLKSAVVTYDLTPYALKTEAFDKKYSSLTGTPTIPAPQVNSDWSSTNGLSQILNKPVLFDKSYTSLTNVPTTFTPSAHTHTIANITGLQTSLDSITRYYNPTAILTQNIKKWITIVTPTRADGFTVDISSAGFSTILGVQVQCERNSATTSDIPLVNVKSKTTTQVVLNIMQNNAATVAILGINVLSGLPLIFASNLSTILLHIEVTGY